MKRQRGRNRNSNNKNNNNHNRSLDSNGPDVKVRGSASHIYEKYVTLARDATSSGHRVKAENYLQHAEHYLRIASVQEAAKQAAREEREARDAARAANSDNNDDEGQERRPARNNNRNRRPREEAQDSDAHSEVQSADDTPKKRPAKKVEPSEPAGLEVVDIEAQSTKDVAPSKASDDVEPPKRRRRAPARKKTDAVDAAE